MFVGSALDSIDVDGKVSNRTAVCIEQFDLHDAIVRQYFDYASRIK
jgi:hypothetical protein